MATVRIPVRPGRSIKNKKKHKTQLLNARSNPHPALSSGPTPSVSPTPTNFEPHSVSSDIRYGGRFGSRSALRLGSRIAGSRGEEGNGSAWSSNVCVPERRARTASLYETRHVAAAWGLFGLIQQAQSAELWAGVWRCVEENAEVTSMQPLRGALRKWGRHI